MAAVPIIKRTFIYWPVTLVHMRRFELLSPLVYNTSPQQTSSTLKMLHPSPRVEGGSFSETRSCWWGEVLRLHVEELQLLKRSLDCIFFNTTPQLTPST
jgi:hypothetical protein